MRKSPWITWRLNKQSLASPLAALPVWALIAVLLQACSGAATSVSDSSKIDSSKIDSSKIDSSMSGSIKTDSARSGDSRSGAEILVQGSDTMENLVEKLAMDFMAANQGMQVGVQPGDTGLGISDLLSGKIDVATASREMTEPEQKLAHGEKAHLKRLMIAKDAVAVVVNPQSKMTEIDLNDLAKIYLGQTTTWQQLDKSLTDEPVRVFGREVSSGTADYFQEHVLKGKPFAASVKLMPSSESLIGAVMGNRLAIGFVGMSQAIKATDKVKVLKLKLTEASPERTISGLSDRDYPLSRPLYLYYNKVNESKVKKFVDYCLGQDGQKTVVSMGFLPAK